MNSLMILLYGMTATGLPNLLSFTEISVPDDDDGEDVETRQSGRLRQQLKSCEFIDLTALGPLCNSGRKIKYYKEKSRPRPRHSIFWDAISGHTILAVHSGKQWNCCETRTNMTLAVAATCTQGRSCPP